MDNRTGLYSKAAKIIRSLPQEVGDAREMIAAARNKEGIKEAELAHAGELPTGETTRNRLAAFFEQKLPRISVDQYGENPDYLNYAQKQRFKELSRMGGQQTEEARREHHDLYNRRMAGPSIYMQEPESDDEEEGPPEELRYEKLNTEGGENLRERLLRLNTGRIGGTGAYFNAHWDHPNVLAHIRMQDRIVGPKWGTPEGHAFAEPLIQKIAAHMGQSDPRYLGSGAAHYGVENGLITPEDAATLSRYKGWNNRYSREPGHDKRILHVEEIQSDWGQEGRENGFAPPEHVHGRVHQHGSSMQQAAAVRNRIADELASQGIPFEEIRKNPDWIAADQAMELAYKRNEMPPRAPYVGNTQHWTELALKNVLREAALGDYDGITITPGQGQVDRYRLQKFVDDLHYHPGNKTLTGSMNGYQNVNQTDVEPDQLHKYVGRELAAKMMQPEYTQNPGTPDQSHRVQGEEMAVGGDGMKKFYDEIIPKNLTRRALLHDRVVKPAEPISFSSPDGEDYQGFHLPMTPKLKDSIVKDGFPAFQRGGMVGFAQGGAPDDPTAQLRPEAPAQAGGFPDAGRVRGGAGLFQAPDEAPLEGLPQNVRVPLTGGMIQAGPDPRIRAVARDYMQSAGLPYNPPTKYAKVDPARAARISKAYDEMADNPDDRLTKASYEAMVKETMAQYEAAKKAGLKIEFWDPARQEDPYLASPRMAVEDIRNNHHMWVFPTYAGYGTGDGPSPEDMRRNPLLRKTGEKWNGIPVTVNDVFRAIHDYYGHAKEGVGFRHDGEENAWRAHASMFSALARMAMTSETRGQNSWLNFGPHGERNRNARTEDTVFAPQKIGILPHWAHHEGAEDFMRPEDIAEMQRHRTLHGPGISKALDLTRGFTKDGGTAMNKPKI